MTLRELANTRWVGRGELWVDPLGNEVDVCECRIELAEDVIRYHWSHDGKPQTGELALRDGGADFSDSWHSPTPMACTAVPEAWSLVSVLGTYPAGDGPDWGWRISVAYRPSDELARRLSGLVPPGLRESREELQQNFKAVLQTGLAKLDLVTREEFEVQRAVLLRTREKLDELQRTVAELEAQLGQPRH